MYSLKMEVACSSETLVFIYNSSIAILGIHSGHLRCPQEPHATDVIEKMQMV